MPRADSDRWTGRAEDRAAKPGINPRVRRGAAAVAVAAGVLQLAGGFYALATDNAQANVLLLLSGGTVCLLLARGLSHMGTKEFGK